MCNCIANPTIKRKRIRRRSTYSITLYRHRRTAMPILIFMMSVFCSVSSSPLATHPYYNPRRRNNTGFYYGLIDDHMLYGINSHYNNCQTSSTTVVAALHSLCDKLMSNHNISTLRQKLLLPLEALAVFKQHQQNSGPSTISSSHNIRGGSIGVSTKQRPKPKQKGRKRKNNTGFYYGIREDVLSYVEKDMGIQELPVSSKQGKQRSPQQGGKKKKKKSSTLSQSPKTNSNKNKVNKKRHQDKSSILSPQDMSKFDTTAGMSTILSETLYELRSMRQEIIALRGELSALKGKQGKFADQQDNEEELFDNSDIIAEEDEIAEDYDNDYEHSSTKRAKLEQVGKDVEKWATRLLFSDEDDDTAATGWKEILCNKMARKKFNKLDRTKVYLKWMPDSRDEKDVESMCPPTPNQEYPCLKCYSTIDAPLDTVCAFLSNPDTIPLYNELVVDHCDVEEITPSSKITWCKMPKVLFVKPRDFVTYCSHRWRSDGTQVIVNQACEHEDMPGVMKEGQGSVCRGFALRGANFISKDPDDPNHKTRITMLSHANPGGGLPSWAMNTAVNGVVQVEPFKFFHNINESICNYQETAKAQSKMSTVGSTKGRSKNPAGIAHLGFTCFWPNGGGLREGDNTHTNHLQQDIWTEDDGYNDDDEDYEDYDS